MWVLDWCLNTVLEHGVMLLVCAFLFFAAGVGCYFLKDRALYVALGILVLGGAIFVLLAGEVPLISAFSCVVWICFLMAIVYVLLTCVNIICSMLARRKKLQAAMFRKVQYTLPEKDNSYVRARLNVALKSQPCEGSEGMHGETIKEKVRAEYIKQLLARLQDSPLTKAERLELQENAKLFSVYIQKTDWSAEDIRTINDIFSYLLKLAAKYTR